MELKGQVSRPLPPQKNHHPFLANQVGFFGILHSQTPWPHLYAFDLYLGHFKAGHMLFLYLETKVLGERNGFRHYF